MDKLRVAHVVHGFGVGGLERSVTRLVNHLDPEVYDHLVFCFGSVGAASDWICPGRARVMGLPKGPGNDLKLIRHLSQQLQTEGVDVVHSHNWGTLVETAWACRRAGVAAQVHGLHGAPTEGSNTSWLRARLRAWVTRASLERVRAVTAVSESVQRQFTEWCGLAAEKIEVITNGVDCVAPETVRKARESSRRRLGFSTETTVIGSVGRLNPVKGFDLALQAVAELAQEGWDLHLVLVGSGTEETVLRRQAQELGLGERLTLATGEINSLPWLAAMDIFLSSSRSEGMSQSILEAMAVGLPLVVTDVGESARLVTPQCGLVAPPENAHALARALLELEDPQRRLGFGEYARQHHQRWYRTEIMVERFDDLYHRIAS